MNFRLSGGIQYLSHFYNATAGRYMLSAAVVRADMWDCELVKDYAANCKWSPFPTERKPNHMHPVPLFRFAHSIVDTNIHYPRYIPDSAINLWRNTPPLYEADFDDDINYDEIAINTTMVMFPDDIVDMTWDQVYEYRRGLPLNMTIDTDELNDPDGSYQAGSDRILGADYNGRSSSLHYQPYAMAETPEQSTWWLPQAASSLNTSRGLFNHRLRRVGSAVLVMPTIAISVQSTAVVGGRSGDHYFDDWMSIRLLFCLIPTDPSYRDESIAKHKGMAFRARSGYSAMLGRLSF
jgi:hypothetical protein